MNFLTAKFQTKSMYLHWVVLRKYSVLVIFEQAIFQTSLSLIFFLIIIRTKQIDFNDKH